MAALLILCGAVSGGCATSSGISTHRLRDLESGEYYAVFEKFEHEEVPCVLVQGFGGRTVGVDLYDKISGLLVRTEEAYIKAGTLKWFYWRNLPKGKYRSVLRVDDEQIDEAEFVLGGKE